MAMKRSILGSGYLSPGSAIVMLIAAVSTVVVLVWPIEKRQGLEFWTFSKTHSQMYAEQLKTWNAQADAEGAHPRVNLFVIDMTALVRRTLSSFWADTPVADMIEVEGNTIGRYVAGPLEDVGFVDLTDLLQEEGIYDLVNPPSFSLWTSRGRVFGLPHDVHPVMLCYRADIVEEAGIDVSEIETWDDFARVLAPLIKDLDGDGRPDRYLLNTWYTNTEWIEPLMLQAGGGTFDESGELIVASKANALVISTIIHWCFGEGRIAIDAPEFSPAANHLKIEGRVVASLMPDWLASTWKNDMPQLSGKLKLMPLPAWEPGGRRTSVYGGTMIAIPKSTKNFDEAWAFVKHLYLSEELAEELYRTTNIITPVRRYWDSDYFNEPDPYFQGQAPGAMYIALAPDVPPRTSSPFRPLAMTRIGEAINDLRKYAQANDIYEVDGLMPEALRLLEEAERRVRAEMSRNVFLTEVTP